MTGWLWDRVVEARARLEPVQSKYQIVFEDPDQPDEPVTVHIPDPGWLAAALAGGILPPISAYLRDKARPDNAPKEHPYAEPVGAMTEEQAIEYLILKDVPRRVWEYRGNRQVLKIVPVEAMPTDKTFRNAWTIKQEAV